MVGGGRPLCAFHMKKERGMREKGEVGRGEKRRKGIRVGLAEKEENLIFGPLTKRGYCDCLLMG